MAAPSLGQYVILGELGRSTLGGVYRARHKTTGEEVALRVLPEALAREPAFQAQWHKGVTEWAALRCDNILAVREIGEAGGRHFVATELSDGPTLTAYLAKQGPLDAGRALEVLRQVSAGLAVAHAAGVTHGDVRPSNIFLRRDGRLQVADFGITAALLSLPKGKTARETALTLYMAPEQFHGGAVDGRADLYALGVTLYEMLAGQPPFPPDVPLAWIYQVVKVKFPNVTEVCGDVPRPLVEMIDSLTAFEAEHRCHSAAGLAAYAQALQRGETQFLAKTAPDLFPERPAEEADPDAAYRLQVLTSFAGELAAPRPAAKPKTPPPRSLPWRWMAAAVAATLLAATAVYAVVFRTPAPPFVITASDVPFKAGSMWVFELQGQRVAMEVAEKRLHNDTVFYKFTLLPEDLGFSFWRAVRKDGWYDYSSLEDATPDRVVKLPLQTGMPRWSGATQGSGGEITSADHDLFWNAEEEEVLTLPAGEFRTIRVRNDRGTESQEDDDIYWLAPEVGVAKVSATSNGARIEIKLIEYSKLR
ncbi:MAG: serine/threonine protein kinase [Candidatus Hydrogenedentes bacterium]|nr:serine/threonine protein kinase [Candidatus Hydrogenedentota bacterium]MBI3118498.1 serine/threonine protein kinase [Candidatus Hydrogenedentota bacterium]